MRISVCIAMLLACLVYGMMPARAAVFMGLDDTQATAMTMPGHGAHRHESAGRQQHHAAPAAPETPPPCPHCDNVGHASFCAACLALVPLASAIRQGHPPFSWPRPQALLPMPDFSPAPMEPPPRA